MQLEWCTAAAKAPLVPRGAHGGESEDRLDLLLQSSTSLSPFGYCSDLQK